MATSCLCQSLWWIKGLSLKKKKKTSLGLYTLTVVYAVILLPNSNVWCFSWGWGWQWSVNCYTSVAPFIVSLAAKEGQVTQLWSIIQNGNTVSKGWEHPEGDRALRYQTFPFVLVLNVFRLLVKVRWGQRMKTAGQEVEKMVFLMALLSYCPKCGGAQLQTAVNHECLHSRYLPLRWLKISSLLCL